MTCANASPTVSKARLLRDFRDDQGSAEPGQITPKRPTLALRLAVSVFGGRPRERSIPIRVFDEGDVQIFSGFPANPASWLFRVTGKTTSRGTAEVLYPKYRDLGLPPEKRFQLRAGLPGPVEDWLRSIPGILKKERESPMSRSPVMLLNVKGKKTFPRLCRVETLCGQVPDGSHRVLAYTLLAPENPDAQVRVRIVTIQPIALALVNCLTLALYFVMNPFLTHKFMMNRFSGTAPLELPEEAAEKKPEGR
jgi:hypothetical protein